MRTLEGDEMPPETRPALRALSGDYFKNLELQIYNKHTQVEWIGSWSVSPVLDNQGETALLLYTVRNITEFQRTQRALKRSNRDLEDFAYSVSHDLQAPQRSIEGFLKIFKTRYSDKIADDGKVYMDRSIKAGERMASMINELLNLSRVNTKNTTFEVVDVDHAVKDVLEDPTSTINQNDTEIVLAALPSLHADPAQIRRLFQNLIMNSIKYNKST